MPASLAVALLGASATVAMSIGGCEDGIPDPADAGQVDRSFDAGVDGSSGSDAAVVGTDGPVLGPDAPDAYAPDAYVAPPDAYVAPPDAYAPPPDAPDGPDH